MVLPLVNCRWLKPAEVVNIEFVKPITTRLYKWKHQQQSSFASKAVKPVIGPNDAL